MKCDGRSDGLEFFGHGFSGCIPSQRLARTVVHQACDVFQGGLSEATQVSAFRGEQAQQVVVVFVGAALPSIARQAIAK